MWGMNALGGLGRQRKPLMMRPDHMPSTLSPNQTPSMLPPDRPQHDAPPPVLANSEGDEDGRSKWMGVMNNAADEFDTNRMEWLQPQEFSAMQGQMQQQPPPPLWEQGVPFMPFGKRRRY